MINLLINYANKLDNAGLKKEADKLDFVVSSLSKRADEVGDPIITPFPLPSGHSPILISPEEMRDESKLIEEAIIIGERAGQDIIEIVDPDGNDDELTVESAINLLYEIYSESIAQGNPNQEDIEEYNLLVRAVKYGRMAENIRRTKDLSRAKKVSEKYLNMPDDDLKREVNRLSESGMLVEAKIFKAKLIRLSNHLDEIGLVKEADILDRFIGSV